MKKELARAALALCVCSFIGSAYATPYATSPTDGSASQAVKDTYTYLIGRRGAASNSMVEGQHLGGINQILKDLHGVLDYEVHGIADTGGVTRYPGFVGARYDDKKKYYDDGTPVPQPWLNAQEVLDPVLNAKINDSLIDLWNTYHPIIQITASPRNPWKQENGRLADAPNINTGKQQIVNLCRSTPLVAGSVDAIARDKFWVEMAILAQGMKQLSNAGVPLILRPFAEWNTGSLSKWWGDKQTGGGFISLWNDIYDYYTGTGTPAVPAGGKSLANQNLHNLLFCWEVWALNRNAESSNISPFYPAGKVDVVGGSYYFKHVDMANYYDGSGNFTFANVNPPFDSNIYEFLVSKNRPFIVSQYGLNNEAPAGVDGDHNFTRAFMSYVSATSGLNPMAAAYYWDDPQQVETELHKTEFVSDARVATVNDLPYTTLSFISESANDGYLREMSETSDSADFLDSTAATLKVGDQVAKRQLKSILSFNTYNLPDTKNIVSATVSLRRSSQIGSPFTQLGACKVDIRNGNFGTGAALAFEDFNNTSAPASAQNVVTNGMPAPAADGDWSDGFLNAAGNAQVNRTGLTQLRVYFNLDDDNVADEDSITWHSGNAAAGSQPVLNVTYRN